jgi:hypothetical protein
MPMDQDPKMIVVANVTITDDISHLPPYMLGESLQVIDIDSFAKSISALIKRILSAVLQYWP